MSTLTNLSLVNPQKSESYEIQRAGTLSIEQVGGELRLTLTYPRGTTTLTLEAGVVQRALEVLEAKKVWDEIDLENIHISTPGNDMKVKFPTGEKIFPQKRDFLVALKQVWKPTLATMYPDIAKAVSEMMKHNPGLLYSFVFTPTQTGQTRNLARYKGRFSSNQLQLLRDIIEIPAGISTHIKGDWIEFVERIDSQSRCILEDVNTYKLGNWMEWELVLFFMDIGSGDLFRNGVLISREDIDRNNKAESGLNLVLVNKSQKPDKFFSNFDEAPTFEVYYPEEKIGPIVHPEFFGKTLSEILNNRRLKGIMGLKKGDKVLCPRCERSECSHQLGREDKLFILRKETEFLYAVQTAHLLGADGTEQFRLWAPIVIGHVVRGYGWPGEVVEMILDGRSIKGHTCGVEVKPRSTINVYLRRP